MHIDQSVYPDQQDPPTVLNTIEDKADYVQRICAAWDFYIHPDPETFELFSRWRNVFDRFPLTMSPAYHAFRAWFGWDPLPIPTGVPGPTPVYLHLDRREGRDDDPCAKMI